MKLEALRKQIDTVDTKILVALKRRILISEKIGKVKKIRHMPIPDKEREDEVLQKATVAAKKLGLTAHFVRTIYSLIIRESKRRQE